MSPSRIVPRLASSPTLLGTNARRRWAMIRQLIAEAERIARPSLLLSEAASFGDIAGWWGGSKPVGYPGRPDDTHRISIDCGWLAGHGVPLAGFVSVYNVAPRWGWRVPVHVEHVPTGKLPEIPRAIPLYSREALSLPPLEALCLYGGQPVETWLSAAGLERTDYDRAATLDAGREYQAHYQERSPLYSTDIAAVVGGWHAIWSDDDFYIPREMRLVLWTLRDAEPWIEVFHRGANLSARVRIT